MRKLVSRALILGLLCPAAFAAQKAKYDINVNVTLTPEGKKLPLTTPQNPAYYFPVVAGYQAAGRTVAGEKPPLDNEVLHLLAKALAKQGYFVFQEGKTPLPTLLLLFHWGYMNPSIDITSTAQLDDEDPTELSFSSFHNKKTMYGLVSGTTDHPLESTDAIQNDQALQDAREDRYFVLVTALDFAAANTKEKKKVVLWQARISTHFGRVSFEQVLPAMVNTGAKYFGRETMPPKRIYVPVSEGKVDVGTPTVVPDAKTGTGSERR